ncbi:MAG: hypothetical protein DYG94_04740 [Leptolyngbya sp. PLA3]|nr:MAG: hypothetical protein EDM82_03890 [Cyanobacteria bacterium CYA]MCE7968039.1 hypothetical protein [Leptolyngbya sp. PL-A3]
MKKGLKALVALFAGLLILLIVVVVGAMVFIDSIARKGVEQGATYALAVPTSLDSADVGVLSGTFDMSGLNVSNPEGFDKTHFLHLGTGGVEVSLGSLRDDLVTLPRLELKDIDINVQQEGATSNVKAILENLKRFESGEKPKTEPAADGKRFIVNELRIENVKVNVKASALGAGMGTTINVPQIVMKDIGSDTGKGVLLGELANIVVKALVTAIRQAGADILPGDLLNQFDAGLADLESLKSMGIDVVNDLGKQATKQIDQAKDQIEKKADDLKKEGEETLEGLKDIFKKPGGG